MNRNDVVSKLDLYESMHKGVKFEVINKEDRLEILTTLEKSGEVAPVFISNELMKSEEETKATIDSYLDVITSVLEDTK